jgi:excinuclease ABC subunit C
MEKLYQNFPEEPGVYLMKDRRGRILYIGKAANLKRRVSSYFGRPHDFRIEKMIQSVAKIDYQKTDTALEALILEAELIKKYQPPFNIREKDDKSFLYVEVTKEKFPRVLLVRGKTKAEGERYGPFVSTASIREALRILRRIFPFHTHPADQIGKFKRPCLEYQLGLCPGTCIGMISAADYNKNIKSLIMFFRGKKKRIIDDLKRRMIRASRQLNFEEAAKIRHQIFAIQHIQDVALIKDENFELSDADFKKLQRIEGYDVSNIAGTLAVGAMVVFYSDRPAKNEYRQFKIRTIQKTDDVGMLKEVLRRRLNHEEWPLPSLILVDGGRGQVNALKQVLAERGLEIPVLGIAKGRRRKKNEFIGRLPKSVSEKTLIKVRDEAHRFAIKYHKRIRTKQLLVN